MTDKEREGLDSFNDKYVSYGYFCGEQEQVFITDDYALERENNE